MNNVTKEMEILKKTLREILEIKNINGNEELL